MFAAPLLCRWRGGGTCSLHCFVRKGGGGGGTVLVVSGIGVARCEVVVHVMHPSAVQQQQQQQ